MMLNLGGAGDFLNAMPRLSLANNLAEEVELVGTASWKHTTGIKQTTITFCRKQATT